jgi:flagellar protein FlbD
MIFVTRLNGTELVINVDQLLTIERTPDTVLTLTTGDRIMVKESLEEIVQRAVSYRHRILQGPGARDGLADIAAAMRQDPNDNPQDNHPDILHDKPDNHHHIPDDNGDRNKD